MNYVNLKVIFLMMIPAVSCASEDNCHVKKLNDSFGSRDSFTSESLNSPPKYILSEESLNSSPATPLARKPALELCSFEEIAAYEIALQERAAFRKAQDEKKQKIAALRTAWVIKHPHAGLDEQEVNNKYRKQDEKELRDNKSAVGCCMACFMPLLLLSSVDSQSCFSMSCFAKPKMA